MKTMIFESIFSCQMEAIVLIILQIFFTASAGIGDNPQFLLKRITYVQTT